METTTGDRFVATVIFKSANNLIQFCLSSIALIRFSYLFFLEFVGAGNLHKQYLQRSATSFNLFHCSPLERTMTSAVIHYNKSHEIERTNLFTRQL